MYCRKQKIREKIEEITRPYGAELIALDYSPKYFGNIIATIRVASGEEYNFILDRDMVYVNSSIGISHIISQKENGPSRLSVFLRCVRQFFEK